MKSGIKVLQKYSICRKEGKNQNLNYTTNFSPLIDAASFKKLIIGNLSSELRYFHNYCCEEAFKFSNVIFIILLSSWC